MTPLQEFDIAMRKDPSGLCLITIYQKDKQTELFVYDNANDNFAHYVFGIPNMDKVDAFQLSKSRVNDYLKYWTTFKGRKNILTAHSLFIHNGLYDYKSVPMYENLR